MEIKSTRVSYYTFTIQLDKSEFAACQNSIRDNYQNILKDMCQMDVGNSHAWNPLDRYDSGCSQKFRWWIYYVNVKVVSSLRDWIADTARSFLPYLAVTLYPRPDSAVAVTPTAESSLDDMLTVALILKNQNMFEESLLLCHQAINAYSAMQTNLRQ